MLRVIFPVCRDRKGYRTCPAIYLRLPWGRPCPGAAAAIGEGIRPVSGRNKVNLACSVGGGHFVQKFRDDVAGIVESLPGLTPNKERS
jgi:hypothetical protein